MKRNSLTLLIFHVLVTSLFIAFYKSSYYDQGNINIIIYLILLILYFLFGYFGRFFVYFELSIKNLLSLSSIFILALTSLILQFFTIFIAPSIYMYLALIWGFLLYSTTSVVELIEYQTITISSEIFISFIILFTYVIATWLGLELRNRNRNGLNKDIKKEESVE